MNDGEKLIYTAGIIDGEGCISIHKRTERSPRSLSPEYYARIDVGNTNKLLIDFLLEEYGGCVTITESNNLKWKTSYTWSLKRSQTLPLLEKIYPFLLLKKPQANLTIEFLKLKNNHSAKGRGHKVPSEETAMRETYYLDMKELNKKGRW